MLDYEKYSKIYEVYLQITFPPYDFFDELVRANSETEAHERLNGKYGECNFQTIEEVSEEYAEKWYDKGVFTPQLYMPIAQEKSGFTGPYRTAFTEENPFL